MAQEETRDKALIKAIALREGTIKQLSVQYKMSREELEEFLEKHKEEIIWVRDQTQQESIEDEDGEPSPTTLDELWISKKAERLERYQSVADDLYQMVKFEQGSLSDGAFSTALRELRFYMTAAANELGQLLHRGSGESGSDSLSVDFNGVNLDNLR